MSCSDCDIHHAIAERLDAWNTAYKALNNREWAEEVLVAPADVLYLAMFLTNGTIGEPQ
ncbi:hypothetical protein [Streptomyces sp. NPDC015131]|uniref:hypothetical protein n=1 Tax=Streptomyces sp. NPDC015131 TaxID=3364941 RepID=UPI0036F7E9F1